jgi:dTDP-4-dehydrorhamnose 3,5-epimerase
MKIINTKISGVVVSESTSIVDSRGAFTRLFCENEFSGVLGRRRIVQINHTITRLAGTVRGMHFQNPPFAETKIVRCLRGQVWDVALDLRKGSPTFLEWHAEILSPENRKAIFIPEGVAHGFQALNDDSELLYLHTAVYEKSAEGGVRFNDPNHSINWPLPVSEISDRDRNHPIINRSWTGIKI